MIYFVNAFSVVKNTCMQCLSWHAIAKSISNYLIFFSESLYPKASFLPFMEPWASVCDICVFISKCSFGNGVFLSLKFNSVSTRHNFYNGLAKKENKGKLGKKREGGGIIIKCLWKYFFFCISKSLQNWIILDVFSDLSLVKLLWDDTGLPQPHLGNWYFTYSVK